MGKKAQLTKRYALTEREQDREKGSRRARRGLLGSRESDGRNPKLEKRARKLPKSTED